ncbi:phosphotransferase enzyme family protein [Penicillium alfredii]|uniref:Phosphotransferase enzyme family protein n=1 Tax=Penicillium alfredii TaxID=1506179 RepID=A0A9W9JYV6_9EURO|nr:phosphotransferase enzyme family protein [Penicillium alfredii]KAJ5086713.1 phosphotransferase enzyme family protein [Penicillium alfredii]
MEAFLDQVGAYRRWDGWVAHKDYDHFKERLERCREQFVNEHSATDEEKRQWRAVWPFMET